MEQYMLHTINTIGEIISAGSIKGCTSRSADCDKVADPMKALKIVYNNIASVISGVMYRST